MNFTEAVNEVVGIVKRADLIADARREVNSAISFYCLDNNFARDYTEQVINLNAQEYTQGFSLSDMTRFRKFHYLKRGGTKCFLRKLSDAELATSCADRDRYYIVGTQVNVSLAELAATLDVGFYAYPPILTGSDSFWLLDLQPYMIIDRACAAIFRKIGDEKSMQAHQISAREAYLASRKDLLSAD